MNLILDQDEVMSLRKLPAVLLALADNHDIEATVADAQGWPQTSAHHQTRSALWRAEARRLQDQIDAGNFPTV